MLLDTELETELSDLEKLGKEQSILIRYGKEAIKDEDKNKSLFLLLRKVHKCQMFMLKFEFIWI